MAKRTQSRQGRISINNALTVPSEIECNARVQGMNIGVLFVNLLFNMPWFNQPYITCLVEMDGTIPGYLARMAYKALQETHGDTLDEQRCMVNICDAFTRVVLEETTASNGKWGTFTDRMKREVLARPPLTLAIIRELYPKFAEGRLDASRQLWASRERDNERESVARIGFRLAALNGATEMALHNLASQQPHDVDVSDLARKMQPTQEELAGIPDEMREGFTSEEWESAFTEGYMLTWNNLLLGKMTVKQLSEKLKLAEKSE